MSKQKLDAKITPDPEIESHLASVVRFYVSGNASLNRHGDRMGYGSLKKGGTSPSKQEELRKARKFAEVYSREQVDKLITLCRGEEYAISISHIKLLVTVDDQATRNELQNLVINNDWSKNQLRTELRRRFGNRRRKAGRRPMQLKTAEEIKPRIGQFAEAWERFRGEMARLSEQEPLALTRAFQDHLQAADKAFAGMTKLIDRSFYPV